MKKIKEEKTKARHNASESPELTNPDRHHLSFGKSCSDQPSRFSFHVMDRGYLDFSRLCKLDQSAAFFVTRAKRGMNARRVYSTPTDRGTDVICDQCITLNGHYASQDYPAHLRRIKYKDPLSAKMLVFLTNNMPLPPLTIAALYKSCW